MSVATITPRPRLAEVATEARRESRAQKRERNPLRKVARGFTVVLAILFATVGLGAGTAQAWPWTDMQEDITAFVTNFCGPEDVPIPQGHGGIDNLFGLNTGESDNRGTILPNTDGLGKEPLNGLDRIQAAYSGEDKVITPTYERYGFQPLQWDSYGAGCFAPGYWFTPMANGLLNMFVMSPIILSMSLLQLALGTTLYTVFTGIISPFVSIFTAIFKGWALWLAPIGIIWAFVRSGGNLRVVAKTGVWMLMIFGIFIWMGNNTSTIVTKANNFVTEFASSAATQINEINGVTTGTDGTAQGSINQSLWYGVPYQTWLEGQVGPQTASADRTRVANGEVSWGAAILNSKHVGNDDDGRDVVADSYKWNGLSYSPNEELADEAFGNQKTKPGAWTKNKIWEDVPYLFNVKAMCGDTSDGKLFTSSSAEDENKWLYGGSCDSAGAGTASMLPHFTGTQYNTRMSTAFSGGFAAVAVCLAIGVAAIYLAVQKMLFYFLLLFGPVFLTVAMFGDQKRAAFAKRYGELMIGNLLKQGVAVLVVLFVANAMSMLLYPPADESFAALRDIPWMLKPSLALFFLIGLAMFLIPLKKIVTGAVKGDTQVVDKTANMPVDAAKTAAKVGAAATVGAAAIAAVVATGGAAAPVVAKGGGMAMSAGRMMGGRGGVGKVLTTAGRGANLASRVGGSLSDGKTKKAALANLAEGVFKGDKNVQEGLAKVPGALDKDGKMTSKGQAIVSDSLKRTGKGGEKAARAEALQNSYMDKFYKGYKAQNGQHHAMDPNNPQNLRAAAVEKEKERQAVQESAKHDSSRTQNTTGKPGAGDGSTGANANGYANAEGKASGNAGTQNGTQASSNAESQKAYAEKARENVTGPGFAQDENIKANVSVDGAQVAEQMGLSAREVAQNPSALLSGAAYDGGDVSKMDPRHAATPAMNELKFAMMAGDQQGIDAATMKASDAISQHGVPSAVAGVSAVSATPEHNESFIGAMPTLSEDTPWQVRAESATTMQAAMSFIPESSPSREPMNNYVQALSDPGVSAQTVNGLGSIVVESASSGSTEPPTVDLSGAIRESAERVSAAPAAVVEQQGALFGDPAPQAEPAPAYQQAAPAFVQAEAPAAEAPPQAAPQAAPQAETPAAEAPAQVAPPQAAPEAPMAVASYANVERTDSGYRATDFEGNVYDGLSNNALAAMPAPPVNQPASAEVHMDVDRLRREFSDISEEAAEKYRQKMSEWRDEHVSGGDMSSNAVTPRHSSGGPISFGGIDLGDAPVDTEEISGMPTEDNEDNSQSFRRSRRRRISGFFDMEEDDDTKDGE